MVIVLIHYEQFVEDRLTELQNCCEPCPTRGKLAISKKEANTSIAIRSSSCRNMRGLGTTMA